MRQENWGEDGWMEREGKSIVGREGSKCKPVVRGEYMLGPLQIISQDQNT